MICFEGLDRSGKGSQVLLLSNFFNTIDISHSVFPAPFRNNVTGSLIDRALTGRFKLPAPSLYHLFVANRHEVLPSILTTLAAGRPVILDRWVSSGWAYGLAQDLDPRVVMTSDRNLLGSDITFYLCGDPSFFATRAGYGGEVYERLEF